MTATRVQRLRRGSWTAAAVAGCIALTACGVPTDGDTRVIPTRNVPYGLLRDSERSAAGQIRATVEPGQVRGQIALVEGESTVRLVERDVAAGSPSKIVELLLRELQRGPTDAERRRGLGSAVTAGVRLRVTGWRQGVLSVDVSGDPNPVSDHLPVAVAQVVLTATSTTGVRAVLLQHDNRTVQVPLADGSLTSAALTRQDYEQFLDGVPTPVGSRQSP